MEKKQPEKKYRAGAVSVTIWRNETEKGSYYSVQLERSYKDKEDNWKKTGSLRANDLPKAALLLNKAYEFVILKEPESQPNVEVEQIM
ncbi:MAG: hypothetical protein GY861_07435 [bacterium]|nr:hypothetical protein [bacterium]